VSIFFAWFKRGHTPLLAVLFAGVLISALDIAIVGPALPAIQNDFGINERGLSWVFSAYILAGLISAPLMAKLSDRYGRRNVYLADIALFGLGSLVVAVAFNFEMLLAGRVLQAFGAGGILPVASAVIGDTFPKERRGPALGLIGAVFGVAFLLGPLLGGLLLQWSWRWLFLINIPLVIIVFWQAARILPSTPASVWLPFDFLGTCFLSLSLLTLALGVSWIDVNALLASLSKPEIVVMLLMSITGLCLLWIIEKRAVDPILSLKLLSRRELKLVAVIAIGTGLAEAGMVFLPALAVAAFNVQEATASLMLVPLVTAMIFGAPLAGWLLAHWGAKHIIQVGLLLVIGGMLVFGMPAVSSKTFYLGGILVGVGLSGILGAPLRYIVIREAPRGQGGAGQGLLTIFLSVGRILGAAAVGGFIASQQKGVEGYQGAYLLVAIMILPVIVFSALLKSDKPIRQDSSSPGS
jgi:EmrB/QacA subfamily drug resistance transporter